MGKTGGLVAVAKSRKRKTVRRSKVLLSAAKNLPAPQTEQLSVVAVALKEYAARLDVASERTKPRLLSLLFCDFASFTLDKKVNLLGIFDRVFVHPENKLTPVFTLYVRTAEAIEEKINVTLFTPDNQAGMGLQFGGEEQVYTPNLPAQVQLVVGLQFKADMEGPYWFDISYKQKSIGGAGLVVEYRTEEKEHGTNTYV